MVGVTSRVGSPDTRAIAAWMFGPVRADGGSWLLFAMVCAGWLQLGMVAMAGLVLDEGGVRGALFAGVISLGLRGVFGGLRWRLTELARRSFLTAATRQICSASAFHAPDSAELEFRLFRALAASTDLIANVYPGIAINGLALMTLGPLAVVRLPAATLPWVAGAAVVTAAGYIFSARFHRTALQRALAADRDLLESVGVLLSGHLEVVASGRAPHFSQALANRAEMWSKAYRHLAQTAGMGGQVATAGLVVLGATAWMGVMPPTTVMNAAADLLLLASVIPAAVGLAQGLVGVRGANSEVGSFLRLVEGPTDPGWLAGGALPVRPDGEVVFDDVAFAYPSSANAAIEHINLVWASGEFLALKGPNGSGKSTLLKLLLRLGDPAQGEIRLGGALLSTVDLLAWRQAIAYSPQGAYLPAEGTVGDAMRVFNPDVDDEVLVDWLERLGVGRALRGRSADPLLAPVRTLSSGEHQRVCLARAFAMNRPVLLLDEPEANLDAAGVEILIGVLAELRKTRRILVAAHDAALIASADRVVQVRMSP